MNTPRIHPRTRFGEPLVLVRLVVSWALCAAPLACGDASDPSPSASRGATAAEPNAALPADANGTLITDANVGTPARLDANRYLSRSSDNTSSFAVPLGSRYRAAASVKVTSSQRSFLASPTQQPSVPSSGLDSDLAYKSFGVTLYPSNGGRPSPQDVMQHGLSNCDGDAAFVALAYGHADYIKSLIQQTSPNSWNVSLFAPDGTGVVVGVNNQFVAMADGSIAAVSGRNGVATWATVLEKALMKYNAVYPIATTSSMGNVAGIGSETTMPMLVADGLSYAFDRGVLSPDELRDEVERALDNGMMVTGGFGKEDFVDGYKTVTSHAYTLLWPKDDATMVSMRNPWGMATSQSTGQYDGSADGVINIALDANWAATIDLRIIGPGRAGMATRPAPYVPQISRLPTRFDVHLLEQALDRQQQRAELERPAD